MGEELIRAARENDGVCAITAGMPLGNRPAAFLRRCIPRFFDVGICEQHALALAAGLAKGGMRPFVAIYSTFCKEVWIRFSRYMSAGAAGSYFWRIALGLQGEDGKAHQGIYDLGFLRGMPNLSIMAPRDILH